MRSHSATSDLLRTKNLGELFRDLKDSDLAVPQYSFVLTLPNHSNLSQALRARNDRRLHYGF